MNVKVAVIDSGIEMAHKAFKKNHIDGYSVVKDGERWIKNMRVFDINGHGTACASVIVNECPNVEILSIGILDVEGKTNLSALEIALESLIDSGVSIINMSLSFRKLVDGELYRICQRLSERNITLIASLENGCEKSYPAVFDNVIGVRHGVLERENEFWFSKHRQIQCVMDCVAPIVAIPKNKYGLILPFNSIATAKLTGIISRMFYSAQISRIDFNSLCDWLQEKSIRNKWNEVEIYERLRVPERTEWYVDDKDFTLISLYQIVCDFFKKKFEQRSICDIELLTRKGVLNIDQVIPFLTFVEKEMHIKLDYLKINRYHLLTVGTLAQYIRTV